MAAEGHHGPAEDHVERAIDGGQRGQPIRATADGTLHAGPRAAGAPRRRRQARRRRGHRRRIPFAHRGLLDSTGATTRMQFCWLQSGIASAIVPGVEFTRDTINAPRRRPWTRRGCRLHARRRHRDDARVFLHTHALRVAWRPCARRRLRLRPDETTRWTSAGDRRAARRAGHDRHLGIRQELRDPDGPALHLRQAERIAEAYLGSRTAELPLVINFSYGFSGGPHDGTGNLELAVEDLIRTRRTGSTGVRACRRSLSCPPATRSARA